MEEKLVPRWAWAESDKITTDLHFILPSAGGVENPPLADSIYIGWGT